MKSQKVIFSILDSPAIGGAENYLLSNLSFLKKNDFQVILATHNQQIKKQYSTEFRIIDLPYRLDLIGNLKGLVKFFFQFPLAIIWILRNLYKLKKNYSQIIVYTPGFTERLVFSPFIKLLNLKLVWIEFGPIGAVIDKNFGFTKLVYRAAHHFVDKVITISENSKLSMINNSSIDQSKIKIIYPGIKLFSSSKKKMLRKHGQSFKNKTNIKNKKIISFVGRIAKEKEVDILIKAFAKLKNKDLHLVIIGDGPAKRDCQQLTKKLKIDHKTTFTGFITDEKRNSILSISNVFVFPSAWSMEGFGISIAEAMALGVPVITTGFGPQREIVSDKKTGLFFKANNSTDLSRKIHQLVSKPTLAKKLEIQGQEEIQKRFNQEAMHQTTLELIQSVCD